MCLVTRGSGANTFGDGTGVEGSGGGDLDMGLGGNSNSGIDSGRDLHNANGRGAVAHSDAIASTGAFGVQPPSGGLGRSSEAGAGAAREQGAQAQTLEDLMATILRNAGQRDGTAAGSGSAWRDDVSAR